MEDFESDTSYRGIKLRDMTREQLITALLETERKRYAEAAQYGAAEMDSLLPKDREVYTGTFPGWRDFATLALVVLGVVTVLSLALKLVGWAS